jgi:hypothetical protein
MQMSPMRASVDKADRREAGEMPELQAAKVGREGEEGREDRMKTCAQLLDGGRLCDRLRTPGSVMCAEHWRESIKRERAARKVKSSVWTCNYDEERAFMQRCFDLGWRYAGRADGSFPPVAGTHEWGVALGGARYWECHQMTRDESLALREIASRLAAAFASPARVAGAAKAIHDALRLAHQGGFVAGVAEELGRARSALVKPREPLKQ